MLFFALLPTDLQVFVLQYWIGIELPTLSALDIAVCSHSFRFDFIAWVIAGCRAWSKGITCLYGEKSNNALARLRWMVDKGLVPVKIELLVTPYWPAHKFGEEIVTMPPEVARKQISDRNEIADIFFLCPPATEVRYRFTGLFEVSAMHEQAFWAALSKDSLPSLESLSFQSLSNGSTDLGGVKAALSVIGHRLRTLAFTGSQCDNDLLFNIISNHCHALESFCFDRCGIVENGRDASTPHYVRLLQANPNMTSFTIDSYTGTTTLAALREIIHAGGSLKVFGAATQLPCRNIFQLLQEFPNLLELTFSHSTSWSCKRLEATLEATLDLLFDEGIFGGESKLSTEDWELIVKVVPVVVKLMLSMELMNQQDNACALLYIGDAYRNSLNDLTLVSIRSSDLPFVNTLLSRCAFLTKLTICRDNNSISSLEIVRLVASTCKGLKELALKRKRKRMGFQFASNGIETSLPIISDADIRDLFCGCTQLEVIQIGVSACITSGILSDILHRRMRLKWLHLEFGSTTIVQGDVHSFQEKAKLLNLIPVPCIKLLHVIEC